MSKIAADLKPGEKFKTAGKREGLTVRKLCLIEVPSSKLGSMVKAVRVFTEEHSDPFLLYRNEVVFKA